MLVSIVVGGAPTPITAVGSRAIDATPGAVKDWAIRTFGENDKTFLLAGIYAAIALLAAIVGVVAANHRRTGLGLAGLLGLVGVAAASADRTTLVGPAAKLAPSLVALLVSVGFLAVFTRSWSRRTSTLEISWSGTGLKPCKKNPAPPGFDRRAFLAVAMASGAVAALGVGTTRVFGDLGARSRDSITLPKATDAAPILTSAMMLDRVTDITAYLTPNDEFYRVDTALSVPQVDAGNWSLKIHGLVDNEIELSFAELLDMPLIERRITLACVSNEVGGHYAGNATWLGVRISDLLAKAGVSADADAVKSTSVDGMTIGTPLAALTDGRDAILAIGMNGEPLPLDHGFPVRMVVPGLYGYVSATKWIVELEVTRFSDFSAYWTDRGFAERAPIKTFSRIDVPKPFANLDPGQNAVAGVAWAQDTGIAMVEVRVDGGSWEQARLAKEDSIDTWRQWVYEWHASAGGHQIEVRASDESGDTQTSRRVPPRPDGATGWHSVNVTVG